MPVEAKVTLQNHPAWAPLEAYQAIQRSISQLRFLMPRPLRIKPFAQLYLKTLADYLNATASATRNHELGEIPEPAAVCQILKRFGS